MDTCVQLAFENSGGAFKLKVAEVGTGRKLESLYAKSVIDVINTEPMPSVSIVKRKRFNNKDFKFMHFSIGGIDCIH